MSLNELINKQIQYMNKNNNSANERFNTVRQSSLTPPEKRYINLELNNLYTDTDTERTETSDVDVQTDTCDIFKNQHIDKKNIEDEQDIDKEITNINYYCVFGGSTVITLVCIIINNFLIYNFTDINLKS